MDAFSARYSFSQSLPASAKAAFDWATDYQPDDLALMGEKGKRTIRKVTNDTIILKEEIFHSGAKITKLKLVKINPRTLSWHNIHINGPNKYSEFLYEISPTGKTKSKLNFTGLLVVYSKKRLSSNELKRIADSERDSDSEVWRRLAKALGEDERAKHRHR